MFVFLSNTVQATKEIYMAKPIGKRALTKTKLTLMQSHNRGTNPKPKAEF